jgi:hypothetical protein
MQANAGRCAHLSRRQPAFGQLPARERLPRPWPPAPASPYLPSCHKASPFSLILWISRIQVSLHNDMRERLPKPLLRAPGFHCLQSCDRKQGLLQHWHKLCAYDAARQRQIEMQLQPEIQSSFNPKHYLHAHTDSWQHARMHRHACTHEHVRAHTHIHTHTHTKTHTHTDRQTETQRE